jgi:hypothetical protein
MKRLARLASRQCRLAPVVLIAAASTGLGAHAVDEYVQAARVAVSPSAIVVHLDLTPGVAIAEGIVDRLDEDGNGRVSPTEAEAYGRAVQGDLRLRLDGADLPLTLDRVEVPTIGEMRDGIGTLRLEFSAAGSGSAGRHRLELTNAHLPDRSVYLANALMPETSGVTIVRQDRDVRQQDYRLEYELRGGRGGPPVWWLIAAGVGLAAHARWRGVRFMNAARPEHR